MRFRPQNDRLNFSFVKETHAIGKKMAGNGRKTAIYNSLSFPNSLYSEKIEDFRVFRSNFFSPGLQRLPETAISTSATLIRIKYQIFTLGSAPQNRIV